MAGQEFLSKLEGALEEKEYASGYTDLSILLSSFQMWRVIRGWRKELQLDYEDKYS